MKNNNLNKKFLITCALPYANGPLHLGHILEHTQADIWVRYKKMRKTNIYFICADDSHGTPIMFKSEKLGINPLNFIFDMYQDHKKDFKDFFIDHDNYHLTHSSENKKFLVYIYNILNKKGFIKNKIISQLYDKNRSMFLPDRFIKGNCPKCLSNNQYGDLCEVCGFKYNSIDLINPISRISNSKLIIKKTKHVFFDLSIFKKNLSLWINEINLQKPILNKIADCLKVGIDLWDISRDYPYFGFKIPNLKNKFFYVWMDATIGYISSFKNLCNFNKEIIFEDYWNVNSNINLYHFIGKDIIYFHLLFWPAILDGINFRKPNRIIVHGHLKINGSKMSKSNDNFISAKEYIKYFDPDFLRYYFSSKLSNNIEDINLDFLEFINKINSNLINKILNLASRISTILNKYFNNLISENLIYDEIYYYFIDQSNKIWDLYENFEYSKVVKLIINLSDLANKYISDKKPWEFINNKKKRTESHLICSTGINLFKIIATYLKPITPKLAIYIENFLEIKLSLFNLNKQIKPFHRINKFEIKYKKINLKEIEKIIKK